MQGSKNEAGIYVQRPAVANLGIQLFYQALAAQGCQCVQLSWTPDYQPSADIAALLDKLL